MDKIVLAYSGGLDTSVLVRWLTDKYKAKIITVTVDAGQYEDLKAIEEIAEKAGAVKHYSIDARREFVKDYILPAIQANALYEGEYPLATALARPLMAQKLIDIAKKEKAKTIAHGCTGKGNDQVRFEVTLRALAPNIEILAPMREWKMGRPEEIEYAKKHRIPIDPKKSPYSIDQNIWGRSVESGVLEQPEVEPPEEIYEWTTDPEKAPAKPQYMRIGFEEGIPTSLNRKKIKHLQLIEKLNDVCGKHGIGRIDHIEDRVVGLKSREIYEAPAARCLIEAHKDLEKMVLTRHELMFKAGVDHHYSWLVYSGLWFDPIRQDLDAFIQQTQKRVTGEVRVKFFKGSVRIVGRSSPYSLYDTKLATYNIDTTFDQSAAKGFIELWGLPTKAAQALIKKNLKKKR
jgi:argininosuccinate synthase